MCRGGGLGRRPAKRRREFVGSGRTRGDGGVAAESGSAPKTAPKITVFRLHPNHSRDPAHPEGPPIPEGPPF